jgi:cell division protein FtsB
VEQNTSNFLQVLISKMDELQRDVTHLVVHLDKQEQTIERLKSEIYYLKEKFIADEAKRR